MSEQLGRGELGAIDLAGEDLVKNALEKGGSLSQIRQRVEVEGRKKDLIARVEAKASEYLESEGEKGDWRAARFVLMDRSDKLALGWREKEEVGIKRQELFTEWMKVQDQVDKIDKAHGSFRDQWGWVEFTSEVLLSQAFPLIMGESNYLKGILG